MPDQPRGNRVEDAAQKEPTAAGDDDQLLLVVVSPSRRQWLELGPLDLQRLAAARIGLADHFIDEAAIGIEIGEVAAATQQQSLPKRSLEVGMRPFDRAILVRHARIVAGWR